MELLNGAVILLIVGASLVGISGQERGGALGLQQSKCIKGIAASLLVLVHIQLALTHPSAFSLLSAGGYLLVGIFFFYSGYGITVKAAGSNRELSQKLPGHLMHIIRLIVITEAFYLFCNICLLGKSYPPGQAIQYLTGIRLLNGAIWYMTALVIIYAAIIMIAWSKRWGGYTTVALLAVCVYLLVCVLRDRPSHELQSCPAFLLGVYAGEHSQRIYELYSGKGVRVRSFLFGAEGFLIANAVIYGVRHFFRDIYLIRVIFGWASTLSFLLMLGAFLFAFRLDNRLLRFLGDHSTGIYLLHLMVIDLMKHHFGPAFDSSNTITLSLAILLATVFLAAVAKEMERGTKRILASAAKRSGHSK